MFLNGYEWRFCDKTSVTVFGKVNKMLEKGLLCLILTKNQLIWSKMFLKSRATFNVKSFEVEDSCPLDGIFLLNQVVQAEVTAVVLPPEWESPGVWTMLRSCWGELELDHNLEEGQWEKVPSVQEPFMFTWAEIFRFQVAIIQTEIQTRRSGL